MQQLDADYCMPVLDELLFQIPEIIDYQARYYKNGQKLYIYALAIAGEERLAEKIKDFLQPALKEGHTLTLCCERLDETNRYMAKSLYAAKRTVIAEE